MERIYSRKSGRNKITKGKVHSKIIDFSIDRSSNVSIIEVHEDAEFYAGQSKVGKQLFMMNDSERLNRLNFNDYYFIYQDIQTKPDFNSSIPIDNRDGNLGPYCHPVQL
jgi:hypothetical protein